MTALETAIDAMDTALELIQETARVASLNELPERALRDALQRHRLRNAKLRTLQARAELRAMHNDMEDR